MDIRWRSELRISLATSWLTVWPGCFLYAISQMRTELVFVDFARQNTKAIV